MYSGMFNSYILTDNYYATDWLLSKHPKKVLLPKWGVSRLVETPEEILSAITHRKTYLSGLELNTALVTAYDAVKDSALEIADELDSVLSNDVIRIPHQFKYIDDEGNPIRWTSVEINCYLAGQGTENILGCKSNDIFSLNGHFGHDELITQAGYEDNTNDNVTSIGLSEIIGNKLVGSVGYTPGCHAGLNVPGKSSHTIKDVHSDLPSLFSQAGATYIAGTGYGIAGRDTNEYSERLMTWVAKP